MSMLLWLSSSSQEAAQSKAVSSEAQLLGGRSTLSGLYGRANRADRVFFLGGGGQRSRVGRLGTQNVQGVAELLKQEAVLACSKKDP